MAQHSVPSLTQNFNQVNQVPTGGFAAQGPVIPGVPSAADFSPLQLQARQAHAAAYHQQVQGYSAPSDAFNPLSFGNFPPVDGNPNFNQPFFGHTNPNFGPNSFTQNAGVFVPNSSPTFGTFSALDLSSGGHPQVGAQAFPSSTNFSPHQPPFGGSASPVFHASGPPSSGMKNR